jgi:hypothetical protein
MKIYVAGPMSPSAWGFTEIPEDWDWNHPAFFRTAAELRCAGHIVVCPAELHEPSSEVPWDWYLRRDLKVLVDCEAIVMLDLWENSKGAQLEHHVAKALGMQVFYDMKELVPVDPMCFDPQPSKHHKSHCDCN